MNEKGRISPAPPGSVWYNQSSHSVVLNFSLVLGNDYALVLSFIFYFNNCFLLLAKASLHIYPSPKFSPVLVFPSSFGGHLI